LGVQVVFIYKNKIFLLTQIEEVKVEKKVEKKAVVKVEVKKGDNRYFRLKGTESHDVDFRELTVPLISFVSGTRVSERITLFIFPPT
jgi:hypothetical protein